MKPVTEAPKPKRPGKQTARKKAPPKDDDDEDDDEEHPKRKVARASASAEMDRRAREAEDKINKKAKPNPHKVAGQRLHETSQMHDMLRSMFPSKFA